MCLIIECEDGVIMMAFFLVNSDNVNVDYMKKKSYITNNEVHLPLSLIAIDILNS